MRRGSAVMLECGALIATERVGDAAARVAVSKRTTRARRPASAGICSDCTPRWPTAIGCWPTARPERRGAAARKRESVHRFLAAAVRAGRSGCACLTPSGSPASSGRSIRFARPTESMQGGLREVRFELNAEQQLQRRNRAAMRDRGPAGRGGAAARRADARGRRPGVCGSESVASGLCFYV
jgi:hypothetical protein